MKRITEIEFVNYKAFYGTGNDNKILIPDGKNVLIYGENGSGKSSIYEGLKQFFNSSDNTIDITPARNIYVPKIRTETEVTEGGAEIFREIPNEVSVYITFTDNVGSEQKIFGVPDNNVRTANYISQANLLNGFLSYRELLRTYLMENPKDRKEFRLKFAQLLIEVILSKQQNTASQRTFQRAWDNLFIPRAWYKEENLETFIKGLRYEINRVNLLLPTILGYFEKQFNVELVLTRSEIVKYHSAKVDRWGKYPVCEVDLKVSLFGEDTDNEEENHLTVLNEARLSALAISIYLASLINTPQDNFVYKILFLDDIFIGLDMGNRLPLLEILKNFKKPIIEQFVDENNDNQLSERLQKIDEVIQIEPEPFFKDYQIFISTYDRHWFSVAKKWLNTRSEGRWHYIEMFANKKPELEFNTPIIYTSLNYLQKAEYYFSKHEYESCANHLRKALEQKIKELLPPNEHYAEYLDTETGINELKKLKNLSQYLAKFTQYCQGNDISASELSELNNLKDWYLNPFSHDNISTPIFKRELERAIALVESLQNFRFQVLLQAGNRLYFNFEDNGRIRQYKIELQENLRYIFSNGQNLLTNPLIRCYEWTRDVEVIENPNWGVDRLFHFYNNKWRALIAQPDIPDFPMATLWTELLQESNNEPLENLINH